MGIAAKLDDIGRPAWIAVMVVSFIVFWPIGLAMLAFLIGSGRMGCWTHHGDDRWHRKAERWQRKMERMQEAASRWTAGQPPSSGNRAFDEYRDETLRRLEGEQRAFRDFLDRLRHAKDKSEFDQFMADRLRRPEGPAPQPQS